MAISFIVYRFLLKRSTKYILKKANDSAIRWGSQSKPIIGGVGFFGVFLFAMLNYFFLYGNHEAVDPKIIGILLVITLSFFMGLADDIVNTSPYFKLLTQLVCAVILIYFNIYINISPNNIINYAITIIWVIGIMNSLNMLDNMDAITAPASLTVILGVIFILLFTTSNQSNFFTITAVGSAASIVGFLFYNWHPAKMYMGDNGSQFLGSLLAIFGIVFFWNAIPENTYMNNSKQFVIVLLAFLVPICDTTTVTINRLIRKQSPFVGGKDHTTHHLNYLGLSPRKIAILLFTISVISVSLSVYIAHFLNNWNTMHFVGFTAFALAIFATLYSITKISKPK